VKLRSILIGCVMTASASFPAAVQQPREPAPVSAGIVVDTSGSIGHKMKLARQLVSELLKSANPLDEFTFVQASDRPVVLSGFVKAGDAIETLTYTQSMGRSALLDGIYLGLQLTKAARNQRRVLLVISDGGDNASRYTETEIGSAISETGVRVYTVGLNQLNDPAERPSLLPRIAERAGGRHFGIENASSVPQTVLELSAAIRAQPK
jgi:Ca-activated chloride channel family protein